MAIRRRTAFILVVIAAICAAALIFSVFANLDRYRPEIISALEEKAGMPVEIGHLSLTLFPSISIRIDGFGLRNPPIFPKGYVIQVPRIDAKIDAGALLHRKIVFKSLVLEKPIFNLISDPDGLWNFENPTKPKSSVVVLPSTVISRVEIRNGQLLMSNLIDPSDRPGPVFLTVDNISSVLHQVNLGSFLDPASSAAATQGALKADSLRFGAIRATSVRAKLRLLREQISLEDVELDAYGGRLLGGLSFNLAGQNAKFSANAQMNGINVVRLLAAFEGGGGEMTGTMEGNLALAGEIEHTDNPLVGVHGTGRLTVRRGEVPSLRLNLNLMKLAHYNDLGPARQDPASFSSIAADFELANLRISSRKINITGYGVDVDGSGSVRVAGADDLAYQGVAEIVTKQSFFTNLVARLYGASLKNGRLLFPFHVSGTLENPKFAEGGTGNPHPH